MNNQELNSALYAKMFSEQEAYKKWLLQLPPDEILNHAYEYTVREDILISLECRDLTSAQAIALMDSPSPLSIIFKEFENLETDHIDTIFECMGSCANVVQAAIPVYPYPADYAHEKGELSLYRASHKANVACKEAVEVSISEYYHDNCLNAKALLEVLRVFGRDRLLYVLASNIRHKEEDDRISDENKKWARSRPTSQDVNLIVDKVHPGLLDLFVDMARGVLLF